MSILDYWRISKAGAKRTLLLVSFCDLCGDGRPHDHHTPMVHSDTAGEWKKIAYYARNDFDTRLLALGLKRAEWSRLDKHLGRELCVLWWALQGSKDPDKTGGAWAKLRPEDRWWLYLKASEDPSWRVALGIALG